MVLRLPRGKGPAMSDNEYARRVWAESHLPKLVTTSQAIEMFGQKNFKGLRTTLVRNGVECYFFKQWPGTVFYDYEQTLIVANEYLLENPHLSSIVTAPVKPADTASKMLPRFQAKRFDMPEHGWTEEQFLAQWSIAALVRPLRDILSRAPSIYNMKAKDAYALIRIIVDPSDSTYGTSGYRLDKNAFVNAVREIAPNQGAEKKLMDVTIRMYQTTNIGKLDPIQVVRVIYELLASKS